MYYSVGVVCACILCVACMWCACLQYYCCFIEFVSCAVAMFVQLQPAEIKHKITHILCLAFNFSCLTFSHCNPDPCIWVGQRFPFRPYSVAFMGRGRPVWPIKINRAICRRLHIYLCFGYHWINWTSIFWSRSFFLKNYLCHVTLTSGSVRCRSVQNPVCSCLLSKNIKTGDREWIAEEGELSQVFKIGIFMWCTPHHILFGW